MESIQVIVAIGAVMLLGALAGGIVAGIKNRNYSRWIAWGFVFPPAVLVLALLPTLKGARPRRPTLDEEDRALEDV
jgi:hypothetical protein